MGPYRRDRCCLVADRVQMSCQRPARGEFTAISRLPVARRDPRRPRVTKCARQLVAKRHGDYGVARSPPAPISRRGGWVCAAPAGRPAVALLAALTFEPPATVERPPPVDGVQV